MCSNNFFAGEPFLDLADCRARAETWCSTTAGMRIHGTTQCRPIEAFRTEEPPLLLPRPAARPLTRRRWSDPKVHRDFHVEVDKAIYWVPHHLVGRRLRARRDSGTVKLYFRGELVKVHPRKAPGQGSPPTRPTCPPARRSTPPAISSASGAWPPVMAPPSASTPSRHLGHALALDQDAPGLPAARPGQEVGPRARRAACRPGPRGRGRRREPRRPHARTGPRGSRPSRCASRHRGRVQGRFARDPSEFASVTEAGR